MKTSCAGLYFVWMFVNKCCLSWYSKIHDYCNFFQLAIILEKSILRLLSLAVLLLSSRGSGNEARQRQRSTVAAKPDIRRLSADVGGVSLILGWQLWLALKGEKMRFILVIRGTAKARHKIQRPINIHTEMTSATLASAWKWWQFPLLLLPARFFQGSFIVSKSDGKWP